MLLHVVANFYMYMVAFIIFHYTLILFYLNLNLFHSSYLTLVLVNYNNLNDDNYCTNYKPQLDMWLPTFISIFGVCIGAYAVV